MKAYPPAPFPRKGVTSVQPCWARLAQIDTPPSGGQVEVV